MHELTCKQCANERIKMMAWYTKPEHCVTAIGKWPLWKCLPDEKAYRNNGLPKEAACV